MNFARVVRTSSAAGDADLRMNALVSLEDKGEGPGEVAARWSALIRDLGDQRIACQIGVHEIAGALKLP